MIARWWYRFWMSQPIERLFRLAEWERIMGREHMREARADLHFFQGERWNAEQMAILRRRQ